LTQQIAELNEKINQIESRGEQAHDFRDQRQNLVQDLSYWLNITAFENADGKVSILTSSGQPLVEELSSWTLTTETGSSGFYDVKWVDNNGNKTDITSAITSGKLGALIEMRDTGIPDLLNQLNTLASGLIKEVNKTHSQGVGLSTFSSLTSDYAVADATEELATVDSGLPFYSEVTNGTFKVWVYDNTGAVVTSADITIDGTTTLNGLQTALDAVNGISAAVNTDNTLTITGDGSNTFAFASDTSNVLTALGLNTFFTGQNATDIGLNTVIEGDVNKIATGLITAAGDYSSGDNQNALAIAGMQDELKMSSGTATFGQYYANLVGYIGSKSQEADKNRGHQEFIVNHLSNYRDSISGVSLDEEMTNLILYQQAYDAAAKLITVADELYQTLLQMV
jgi:flagellar hook-associated protein 1 FlgK